MSAFWFAGWLFTFVYCDEKSGIVDSIIGLILCAIAWPIFLADKIRKES